MPRPLKRGILGASTIIISKDIDKYAFMCCSNFYETDVSYLINSFALMSLINQWLGLVNGRLLSLRYKTLSKECNEINNGDVVSSIKLLQMALNRNWLITVESVTKFPRAKGLCFSYISISSRIVKVCDIQSLNNIIVWNSGHVTFLDKNIWIQRTVKAKSGLKTISV